MAEDNSTQQNTNSSSENKFNFTQDEKNLTISFLQFVRNKVSDIQNLDNDTLHMADGLTQALEALFQINDIDFAFEPSRPLLDVFVEGERPFKEKIAERSPEDLAAEAESLKEKGNAELQASNFDGALHHYDEAIKLNPKPVYFCNRAAAYCRIGRHDRAIHDCRVAIGLDPKYGKAYGRLGLALSCNHLYAPAIEAYKKAIELEPEVQSYKSNLEMAEANLKKMNDKSSNQGRAGGGGLSNMDDIMSSINRMVGENGMPDLSAAANILQTPQFAEMANRFLSDPEAINMAANMWGPLLGGAPGHGGASAGGTNFMDMANTFRDYMQNANPDVFENLRNLGRNNQQNNDGNNDQAGNNGQN
uniref:TPR_REGION domain-containing protein n=1 Tax=Parastrongyloides trichosuri TaxID=131310 RepID=A0A0N4ZFB7_PARTI